MKAFYFVASTLLLMGCSNGAEGVIRWSYRSCVAGDAAPPMTADASDDAGPIADAAAVPTPPSCERAMSNVANTASPTPRPNPQILRCFSAVSGTGAAQTVSVGFIAKDTGGTMLELSANNANAVAATTVGMPVQSCVVRITEGMRVGTGECGNGCTVTIIGVDANTGTINGSINCTRIMENGSERFWMLRNAEGVPSMNADFNVTKCEPVAPFTR